MYIIEVKGGDFLSTVRYIHEMPIHILQEFIIIIRSNEKFIGEGKVEDYFIKKTEKHAVIIYDNGKISYTVNFTRDDDGNWFFNDKATVRESLKMQSKKEVVEKYFPAIEN